MRTDVIAQPGPVVVVVVFLTLTDPLRIQPWSKECCMLYDVCYMVVLATLVVIYAVCYMLCSIYCILRAVCYMVVLP